MYYCSAAHLDSEQLYKFLDEVFEEDRYTVPKKVIVPIDVMYSKNHISIHSEYDNVNTTLSNLDSFIINREVKNTTLLEVDSGDTEIDIVYMHFREGLVCSILGILLYVIYFILVGYLPLEKAKEEQT